MANHKFQNPSVNFKSAIYVESAPSQNVSHTGGQSPHWLIGDCSRFSLPKINGTFHLHILFGWEPKRDLPIFCVHLSAHRKRLIARATLGVELIEFGLFLVACSYCKCVWASNFWCTQPLISDPLCFENCLRFGAPLIHGFIFVCFACLRRLVGEGTSEKSHNSRLFKTPYFAAIY